MQDVQFHPVNEQILHVDFMELNDKKQIKIDIPVKLEGVAVGVTKGGKLFTKLKKVTIKAFPADLPDFISVDVTNLEVGKSVKVSDIKPANYTILNSKSIPLASVVTTRALKEEAADPKAAAAKAAPKK